MPKMIFKKIWSWWKISLQFFKNTLGVSIHNPYVSIHQSVPCIDTCTPMYRYIDVIEVQLWQLSYFEQATNWRFKQSLNPLCCQRPTWDVSTSCSSIIFKKFGIYLMQLRSIGRKSPFRTEKTLTLLFLQILS